MCTALSLTTDSHYFGRNLDLECTYGESVVLTPRRFPLSFRFLPPQDTHYAMIGMAAVRDDCPLYFDAVNEAGLAAAGLNFPGYAHYAPAQEGKQNAASFELIPWLLGRCASVEEARALLAGAVVCDAAFSAALPPSPLHWMLSDARGSLVIEPLESGLHLSDNPAGVLTNSPPLDHHMNRLRDFASLSPEAQQNTFAPALDLAPVSRGTGTLGLPGDLTSSSRFIRAAYLRAHSVCPPGEMESVSQFFHILDAVSHVRGTVKFNGEYEITQYASCINTGTGVYYYTTYDNRQITAVDMRREDLDRRRIIAYPLLTAQQIRLQNG